MSFDGNGNYNLPTTSVTPAVSTTTIESADFNTFTADLETALSLCIVKDGQTINPKINSPHVNEAVAMTSTSTELNLLDGATVTTAEINILDGVTSTATELNILDGVTRTTADVEDLATVTGTETLTNKTLTSPVINEVLDASSNELVTFGSNASAVNNIRITNTATGIFPQIWAQGESNIGMTLYGSNNAILLHLATIASAVNYVKLTASSTGNAVDVQATGTDTNIDLTLTPKGSGTVTLPADCITSTQIALDAVGQGEIAANAVRFTSEMENVTVNYDFLFEDTDSQIVDAGMYNYGKDMPSVGTMNGTLKLQVQIDSGWEDVFSVTVTNGASSIPAGQITSNGSDVRQTFTYSTGTKSFISFRMTKIYR